MFSDLRAKRNIWQFLVIIILVHSSYASLNLLPSAYWAQTATTVAGQAGGSYGPSNGYLDENSGIAISTDDILYIADQNNNRVVVVNLSSLAIIRNIGTGQGSGSSQFHWPVGLAITTTSIYVLDNGNDRVQKWSINGTNPSTVPGAGSLSNSLFMFLDSYGSLYVSNVDDNVIIRFAANSSVSVTIAGTGSSGSQSNRFNSPHGIFVTDNRTLYVADFDNHRIQMWNYGASSGSTVAGTGTSGSGLNQLNNPSTLAVDNNGYMYIVDLGNNRILRWKSGATSGICIVACTGASGKTNNKLDYPTGIAFDSTGSLYICDYDNNRVQKFQVYNNTNPITTASYTTSKSTIKTTQVPSTVQTSSFHSTNQMVTSTAKKVSTSVSSTQLSSLAKSSLPATTQLSKITTIYPMTTSVTESTAIVSATASLTTMSLKTITSQIFSTKNHVQTTITSALPAQAIILVQSMFTTTEALPATTTSKTIITSQSSSTNNHAQTSITSASPTQAVTVVQSMFTTTEALLETQTSKTIITSQSSLTNNHAQTSITSALSAQAVTVVQPIFTTTDALLETQTSKTIITSQSSLTNNHAQTSITSALSAQAVTVVQPIFTTTDALLETTTSKTITISQSPSADNYVETTAPSTLTSTLSTIKILSETTTSKTISTSSNHDPQTSQQPSINIQTINGSHTSQQIPTLYTLKTTAVSNLVSTQSTRMVTASPMSWVSGPNMSTVGSSVQSSTSTMRRLNCSNAIITLSPRNPLVTMPLEIERSQAFSISSTLQLNCTQSLAVIQQWSVEQCLDSLCSTTKQIKLSLSSMTSGELFIPSKTLPYGIYQMKLTVQMSAEIKLISSALTFVQIIPSPIQVKLIQFNPSIIIQGQQQTLILNPGIFSVDPDQTYFNSQIWNYTYFCQKYDNQMFTNMNETMLSIDDTITSSNTSCFKNSTGNQTLWQYGINSSRSSLTIYSGSLLSNHTYFFKVQLNNIRNSSISYTGDLLVQVEDQMSKTLVIKCVIATMCISKDDYQMITPTTQLALTSFCIDNCYNLSTTMEIDWNIYYGIFNSSSNLVQWTKFDNKTQYVNQWFFGMNSSNFTTTKDLFVTYSSIQYWRFEVIYSVGSTKNVGLMDLMINSPPSNGSCSVSPLNGTTLTLFTITCFNWFDSDGIQDYSFYTWTINQTNRLMLGYGTSNSIQVRMPIGDLSLTQVQIVVRVRDQYDSSTELDLPSISVIPDINNIVSLMNTMENSDYNNNMSLNPIVNILYSGNQNDVCQLLTSISQILNIFAQQNLQTAINNNRSAATISISPLKQDGNIQTSSLYNIPFNFTTYNQQLNMFASLQEYLTLFISNLTITTIDSILLQASTLSQLTATTNELTRNAITTASIRCLELSYAVLNYAGTIPYEDVQLATTYIAECASNVLTAVNGPLQDRTIVLELDTSRANALPADYDTDLEYFWSNRNLFADGDDFSQATIEKNRNLYYQRQLAQTIDQQFEETMLIITEALDLHQNLDQSSLINTSSITMSLKRLTSETLSNQTIQLNDNTQIHIPDNLHFNSTISLRCIQTPLSMAGNQKQTYTNMSNLLLITIFDENYNEIPVNTTVEKPIEFFISRDINLIVPTMNLQNVSWSTNDTLLNNQPFNLHFINITQSNKNISISIHLEMHPLDITLAYMLIYKFDNTPQLNSSIISIDGWSILCPQNLTNDGIYNYFIDNEKSNGHQSIIYGIRELNSTEFEIYCVNMSNNLLITDRSMNFSSNYELRIYTSGCYYLDSNNNWQSDGLLVGSLTTHERTQCYSTHLSTFAGGFIVLPDPINWNYVFSHADFLHNKTIYLTVIIIVVLFIILSIYARYFDKQDSKKLGVAFLSNDQSGNNYFYQIVVFTGIRRHAGTSAKVHFVMSGDDDETDTCTLTNPDRKILERGAIDSFVLGVPRSLGLLNYMRIWHDNSGQHSAPSWFLKYVIVRDLQTMQKYYFICQQWLSVEKEDGKIERVLPVSNVNQMRKIVNSLSEKAYHSLIDDHLWFSIFSRPPATKFTRVQRCICCFVLLFTVMLLNILYYDQIQEANTTAGVNGFSIGPFYFTKEQIVIGIITDVLIFIPSILLVTLFRRIRLRRPADQMSKIIEIISKSRINQTPTVETRKMTKKRVILLPWWCLFIAYTLSYLLLGGSILLIIARGIEFGDSKTKKWLASIMISIFSSILLSQPIKVLGIAVFMVIINRSSKHRKKSKEIFDENEEFYLDGDEKCIHPIETNIPSSTSRKHPSVHHLNKTDVAEARTVRLREIRIWSMIRQLLFYGCYLVILYTVSYANRNPYSFDQVYHLRNFFLNSDRSSYNYLQITTVDQFWQWLEVSFVSNIRAQPWYNGDEPQNLNGFINDKTTRLIGWPIMRQLRLKSNSSCFISRSMHPLISTCKDDSNLDHQSWFPGWTLTNENHTLYSQSIENAFTYQNDKKYYVYESDGTSSSYDNGGYIYEFRGRLNEMKDNLTKLRELSWIDSQTRVILIQLTLYNSNVQLFTSITFILNFFSTGGIFPQSRFDPIDLFDQFSSISSIIYGLIALIYMFFILSFTIIEINSFLKLKRKYFSSIWSFFQCGVILCSWTGLGIYIWRIYESSNLGKIFRETNGYEYVNLQLIVYIDQILLILFGFSCFFSTIKCLHLFRYNRRLSQFGQTLIYVQKDLFYFAWTFFLIFISFLSLFYLLFYSKILSCSDLFRTAEMLFEMLLLKFDAGDLYEADTFLGPLVFTFFIYFIVFICCTMVISIINDGFRHVRSIQKSTINEDNDVLSYFAEKIKRIINMMKKKENKAGDNQNSENEKTKTSVLFEKSNPVGLKKNKSRIISSNLSRRSGTLSTYISDINVEDIDD